MAEDDRGGGEIALSSESARRASPEPFVACMASSAVGGNGVPRHGGAIVERRAKMHERRCESEGRKSELCCSTSHTPGLAERPLVPPLVDVTRTCSHSHGHKPGPA